MNTSPYKFFGILLASAFIFPTLTYFVIPQIVPIGPMVLIIDFLLFLALLALSIWSIFAGTSLKKQGQRVAGMTTIAAGIAIFLFSALFIFVVIHISLYGFQL